MIFQKIKRPALVALLLLPYLLAAQCNVVINEIMFSPPYSGNNSMHNNLTTTVGDSTAEWIELYNPSSCTPADISCWILGSDESSLTGGTNYGVFVFPQGTVIPPHGFLVIGGKFAAVKDFDCQSSSQYCGYSRWFLQNANGWIGLYKNTGAVMDAVYWSSAGANALNTNGEFANSIDSTASMFTGFPGTKKNYTCICPGTVINQMRAKNIPGIEFAGTSSGALGQGWKRSVDGGNTWVSETPAQSSPKACNGGCAQPLAANAAGTNPSCGGTGSATATATGGMPPYSYSWSSGQTTSSVNGLNGGTYTCTVTDNCGCQKTATVTIIPAASPFTVSVTHNDANCFGGVGTASVSVSGGSGPFTYTWSSSPQQNTASATNLPAGTYTVNISGGGCSASQTVTIGQPTQLTLSQNTSPSSCGGSNGSATVTASGATPPYTYSWSPMGGSVASAGNLPAGNYTATVTDNSGCVQSIAATVSNNNTNIVVNVSSIPASCTAANGSATANPSGGAAPYTYTWSTSPTQTSATANNLSAGVYTVTVADNNSCQVSQTVTVASQGGLTIGMAAQNEFCGQANGTATATPSGGTAPFNVSWNTSPIQTNLTATNLSAGNYSVTVTDAMGCTTTDTVTIYDITNIAAGASSSPAICSAANGSATVTTSNGAAPFTYQWSDGQTTQTATNLAAGNHSCTVTDNLGCALTVTVSVLTTNLLITSVSSSSPAICTNPTGSATVTPTNGTQPYIYQWSNGVSTQIISALASGDYSVAITDANGCVGTQSVHVGHSQPNLSISFSPAPAICTNNSGSVTATVLGGQAPYTFNWSNGQTNSSITNLAPGNYSLTVVDQNGCDSSANVTIGTMTSTLNISSLIQNETCGKSNGVITLNISGGTSPYTYAWNTGSVLQNSSNLSAGIYYVNVTDANGCAASDTFSLSNSANIAFTSASNPDHCNKQTGSLTVNPTNGSAPFIYSWSTGASSQTVGGLGSGTYTVTMADALGCTATSTLAVVNLDDIFSGSISGNNQLDQDEATSLQANIPNGWSELYWIDDKGDTITSNSLSLIYPYPAYGNYSVTLFVQSVNGCLSSVGYPIYVEPSWSFYVPNAMSPNGDGTNDLFFPKFTGVEEMKGWVYDRWGVNCYEFKTVGDAWDGSYKGEKVPEDVYSYKFDFKDLKGVKHSVIGTVSVIK